MPATKENGFVEQRNRVGRPATKNVKQVLAVKDIGAADPQSEILSIGIKCVTPGLPKNVFGADIQTKLESVVNVQNDIIRARNKRSLADVNGWDVNDEKENHEGEEYDDEYEEDEDHEEEDAHEEENVHEDVENHSDAEKGNERSSRDSGDSGDDSASSYENNLRYTSSLKGNKITQTRSIKRSNVPSELSFTKVGAAPEQKVAGSDGNPDSEKPKVSIKYLGYSQKPSPVTEQNRYGFQQYASMHQQQFMFHQQLALQMQQYQTMQTSPQVMGQFAARNHLMNPGLINPIFYSQQQNALKQLHNKHVDINRGQVYSHDKIGGFKNTLEYPVPNASRNNSESGDPNAFKKHSESVDTHPSVSESGDANPQHFQLHVSETGSLHFGGIIKINSDSFQFEFDTPKSQIAGRTPGEVSLLLKQKFLKVCEKTWDETFWLDQKRKIYSSISPTNLAGTADLRENYDDNHSNEMSPSSGNENDKQTTISDTGEEE